MSTIPQHVTELIDSLIKAYPTGLPDGIHMNINLNVQAGSARHQESEHIDIPIEPGENSSVSKPAPESPAYKGQFLGLYRVVGNNESGRIKIRSGPELKAPEVDVRLTDKQYAFIRSLNPNRLPYFESSGYIFKSNNGSQNIFYKQFGFDKQLLVISEIKRIGDARMGRVVGIGNDPYLSDPKPLNAQVTNYKTTPWLVHHIESVDIYAPILASDNASGWVNMMDVEKVR
jgi:hypothetical protein